jgi:hypothetical protein
VKDEHDLLELVTLLMSRGSSIGAGWFHANDGLVPLQSALFLSDLSGTAATVNADDTVSVSMDKIGNDPIDFRISNATSGQ